MSTGKVKFFNERKGFGFIIDDESQKDLFVHVSGIIDKIQENDDVVFDITEDQRGKKAINVKKSIILLQLMQKKAARRVAFFLQRHPYFVRAPHGLPLFCQHHRHDQHENIFLFVFVIDWKKDASPVGS